MSTSEKTCTQNIPIKKTSIVWLYFTETNHPTKLKCLKCNKLCSFRRKSTGNLMRHMKLKHPDLYASHHASNLNNSTSLSHSPDLSDDGNKSVVVEKTNDLHASHHASNLNNISLSCLQDLSDDENKSALVEKTNKDNNYSEDPVHIDAIQCENSAEIPKPSNVEEQNSLKTITYYLMEPTEGNQAKEINNQILKVIVKEFYSFDLVENQEFISFVNMLNANYTIPNYKLLSEDLLMETYLSTVKRLKCTLKEIKYITLAIERWTSPENENFIAVTAYYLNKDLMLENSFLDCISFPKDISINISIFLQKVVGNWRISDKVVAVVSEDDSIIVEAIKECQWQHISCFAHKFNTIVMTCLEEINDAINKVRNIVDYFKRTPSAMTKLQTCQKEKGITNIKLKKDIPNRWNSIFEMITSFLKIKEILRTGLIKDLPCKLSLNDWLVLGSAVKLLVVFNTITVEICSEKVLILSKIPYMIRFMLKHVTNIIENTILPTKVIDMGNKLKWELLQQSKIIERNDIICQSVLLDPRLKKRGFLENSFEVAYSSLIKDVISLKNKKMHETWIAQSGMKEKMDTKQEYFIDIWSEFRETEKPPEKDFTSDAAAEVDAFLNEEYITMKDNPMTYWSNEVNQTKFPVLFELVKSRLCAPASCIPCKNIFSKTGNVLIEKRNCLPSKNLREILFLHHNL